MEGRQAHGERPNDGCGESVSGHAENPRRHLQGRAVCDDVGSRDAGRGAEALQVLESVGGLGGGQTQ